MNILFICTSAKDRSPALVEYFKEVYPLHEYRSAGVNRYFTSKKSTHYLTEEDINWATLIVFAEQVHLDICKRDFPKFQFYKHHEFDGGIWSDEVELDKEFGILECGEYQQGCVGEDYLSKAELKLRPILEKKKVKS